MHVASSALDLILSSVVSLVLVGVTLAIPFVQDWVSRIVSGHAQHQFNARIERLKLDFGKELEAHKSSLNERAEELKSALRKSEAQFNAEMQTAERQIKTLTDASLAFTSRRNEALEARRLQAVERIWVAKGQADKLRFALQIMAAIDFDKSAKAIGHDANAKKFFEMLRDVAARPELLKDFAPIQPERPFVTPRVWAIYSAYFAVVSFAYTQLNMLAIGDPKLASVGLSDVAVNKMLKEALPELGKIIDDHGVAIHPHLIDKLEQDLLTATSDMLAGKADDEATVKRMATIAKLAQEVVAGERTSSLAVPAGIKAAAPSGKA